MQPIVNPKKKKPIRRMKGEREEEEECIDMIEMRGANHTHNRQRGVAPPALLLSLSLLLISPSFIIYSSSS